MEGLELMLAEELENQARQQLMNQALFHMLEQSEGQQVVIPMKVLREGGRMGGVKVEVDPKAETITLIPVSMEAAQAMAESVYQEQH